MSVRQAGQIRQYICDSEADLASITSPGVGSFAVCEAEDSQWFYGASGWTQTSSAGGLPSWFQFGADSPIGAVTPQQIGAVYVDQTNGGFYIAIGATNTDWALTGGNTIYTPSQFLGQIDTPNGIQIVSRSGKYVSITNADGTYIWVFQADGGLTLPSGNALYNTAATPAAGVGANGDWALTGDGSLCRKVSGSWVVVVSEAPGFRALTSPPVSTTVYQNTTGFDLTASLRAVLAVNPVLASDCKVEISPDNFGSAQVWADPALAAGALAVANAPEYIEFPIPANWYYKVTATNTTIGALVAIG